MTDTKQIFSRQQRPTMTQIAADNIREAIENGHLKPGTRIIESRLSEQLGMSRFPIREALCYLEKEGLVDTIPFKGVKVSEITHKDIEDIMILRASLEELAIRLTIKNMDVQKNKRLKKIFDQMETVITSGAREDVLNADLDFHQTICEFSENSRLLNSWMPLASQIRVCLQLEYPLFLTAEEFLETHNPLFNAIESRDEESAAFHIREHIIGSMNRLFKPETKDIS